MPTANLARLGHWIREARTERHLTQEQLAEAAGITKKYVSGIENGKNNPTYSVLCRLVTVLQLPVESLFFPSANNEYDGVDTLLSSYRRCPEKERDLLLRMTAHFVEELNHRL